MLKSRFVSELYRQILRRNPNPGEISRFILDTAVGNDLPVRIGSMINSREFEIMILPELVRKATEEYQGGNVFFLHVPKTAGTSVRLALSDSMGVPSFNLYSRTVPKPPRLPTSMQFWPLWAGHANLHFYPETHSGLTIFRESRSRILSRFRQSQYEWLKLSPHLITPKSGAVPKKEPINFNEWINRSDKGIAQWYLSNPASMYESPSWRKYVNDLSELDLAHNLEKGLKRFAAAAWIHNPEDVLKSIGIVTGKELNSLPRENEFKETKLFKEVVINSSTLQILEEVRKRDAIVFKVASELGILVGELKENEDALFDTTLKRLGFRLK